MTLGPERIFDKKYGFRIAKISPYVNELNI